MKLHISKYITIIFLNVLGPHLAKCLEESISDSFNSTLIDESTDVSIVKFLGITIIKLDKNFKWIICAYLSLV